MYYIQGFAFLLTPLEKLIEEIKEKIVSSGWPPPWSAGKQIFKTTFGRHLLF
jgi:hypothetical protein